MNKLSLVFPTQGNPISVKTTLDSTKGVVDEIVIGSVCVFKDDFDIIKSYQNEYNLKVIDLPFDFVFKNGFSHTLNTLISHTSNNLFLYLNTGEIIQSRKDDIKERISEEYNAYYIDHLQERHRWWRVGDKRYLQWGGLIHEELGPDENYRPCNKPLFTFADTEKDSVSSFKSKVYNDIKECTYWRQLMQIADNPELIGLTNNGWRQFAIDTYQSMVDRINKKGDRFQYFIDGDYESLMNDYYTNKEFAKERFESNNAIEFQGSPLYLGKK